MNTTLNPNTVVLCINGEEMPITRPMAQELCRERLCEPDDENGRYITPARGVTLTTIQRYLLFAGD